MLGADFDCRLLIIIVNGDGLCRHAVRSEGLAEPFTLWQGDGSFDGFNLNGSCAPVSADGSAVLREFHADIFTTPAGGYEDFFTGFELIGVDSGYCKGRESGF